MKTLVYVEHEGGQVKDATLAAVTAASKLGEVHALVAGHNVGAVAEAASKVAGVSVDRPKMNEPSTWTSASRNFCSRVTSPSPASLKFLNTAFSPSGVTDSTPTSAPRMCARRMAARNAGSSAASIVICV